jgi:Uma2 family endonuclease
MKLAFWQGEIHMVALRDRVLMTVEEYFAWEETQEERHEYWDGEVVAMAGTTKDHHRVTREFSNQLNRAFGDGGRCEVFTADLRVRVEPRRKYFYPDLVVTCDDREDEDLYVKYPCLIVEVLSLSTEAVDRGIKFAKYRKILSLKEYVLVQVTQPGVEVYQRGDRGQWIYSTYGMDDRILLESVGVEIVVADLYRQVKFEAVEDDRADDRDDEPEVDA